MTNYRLAVVAGDGIGPEVVAEGLKCLAAATEGTDVTFETTEFDLGARRWHADRRHPHQRGFGGDCQP